MKGAKRGVPARATTQTLIGLQFPVGRIHRYLKERLNKRVRVSPTAAIYTAAVLEYLVAEILELGGIACKDFKVKRITPRHLLLAINGDQELALLVPATIRSGGVVPHIHRQLLVVKSKQ